MLFTSQGSKSPGGTTTTIKALPSSRVSNKHGRTFSNAASSMFPSSVTDRTFDVFQRDALQAKASPAIRVHRGSESAREKGSARAGSCNEQRREKSTTSSRPSSGRRSRPALSNAPTPGSHIVQTRKEEAWQLLTIGSTRIAEGKEQQKE